MKILSLFFAVLLLLSCSGLTEPEEGATDSLWVFVYNGDLNSIKVEDVSVSFKNVDVIDTSMEITEIDSVTFDTTYTFDTTEVEKRFVTVNKTTDINLNDSEVEDNSGEALTSYKLSINKENRVVVNSSALKYNIIEGDSTVSKDIAKYSVYAKEDYVFAKMFIETHDAQDTTIQHEYEFLEENKEK